MNKNIPYVKQYNESGVLLNPIKKDYTSPFPNRRQRRRKDERFIGNNRGAHLTVSGVHRYERVVQLITTVKKRIGHYILKQIK